MENPTMEKQPGLLKPALNYGLLIAVALIVISLIFYLAGGYASGARTWTELGVLFIGLTYACIMFRNEVNGGFVSYGRSLGLSTLTGLFTGFIYGIFAYVLLAFISPDLMEQIRNETLMATEQMHLTINPNISSEELDRFVDLGLMFITPFMYFVQAILGKVFWGFAGGLIISIFVKRKPPVPMV